MVTGITKSSKAITYLILFWFVISNYDAMLGTMDDLLLILC
jgi:hypothetical protein